MKATLEAIWLEGGSAPRDGTVFLGDFGLPWAVATVWNSASAKWVYAQPAAEALDDGAVDWYFENEWEGSENLRRWRPLPVVVTDQRQEAP